MKVTRAAAALLPSLLLFGGDVAANGPRVAFIGCPVLRDMQLPELPCWLAEHEGELYFLGMQSDIIPPVTFYPPQLLHRVLVEGEAVEGEKICGGLPLKNVRVSVLPELDRSCNTVLPPEGFSAPPMKKESPPFRKGRRLATEPRAGSRVEYALRQPPRPKPPFNARSYQIDFAFGDDFVHLDDGLIIRNAVAYFEYVKASKMTVEVYRDRVQLDNGNVLEEDAIDAQRRADRIQSILKEWGVPEANVEIHMTRHATPGKRYAMLTVYP